MWAQDPNLSTQALDACCLTRREVTYRASETTLGGHKIQGGWPGRGVVTMETIKAASPAGRAASLLQTKEGRPLLPRLAFRGRHPAVSITSKVPSNPAAPRKHEHRPQHQGFPRLIGFPVYL